MHLLKKAQYVGFPHQPELNHENIVKEIMKVAPGELRGQERFITTSLGGSYDDYYEVTINTPYLENDVRSRVEIQLDSTFNDARYSEKGKRVEFQISH